MSDSDFNTPPDLLDLIHQLDPRGIGLDPCSNSTSMVGAKAIYTIETNGLAHSWRGHGLVFMNPPHSMSPNNIEPWIEKAYGEFVGESLDGDSFVGLVPSKTGPAWIQSYVPLFGSKCFLKGRIRFWQNGAPTPGPGKFDYLLIYEGDNPAKFVELFGPLGWIV